MLLPKKSFLFTTNIGSLKLRVLTWHGFSHFIDSLVNLGPLLLDSLHTFPLQIFQVDDAMIYWMLSDQQSVSW